MFGFFFFSFFMFISRLFMCVMFRVSLVFRQRLRLCLFVFISMFLFTRGSLF